MKRGFIAAALALLAIAATAQPSPHTSGSLNRGLANSLYCQLAGCTMTGTEFLPNGSSAAPSQSFANFPTIGLYANTNLALAQGTGTLLVTGTTAAPGALTTALVVAAGNIDAGSHSYQVTFVTAGGETSAGTTSNSVVNDGTHAQNTLSAVPVGSQFVTQRKIYRNKVADQTHFFLQQTIADNTSTTGVQDNTADSGLGAAAPTTNTAIDTRLTLTNGPINAGALLMGSGTATAPTYAFSAQSTSGVYFISSNLVGIAGGGTLHFGIGTNGGLGVANGGQIGISAAANTTSDAILTRRAAANWNLGAADAVAPVAQTVTAQGARGGTDTNGGGVVTTFVPSLGTGNNTGLPGDQFTIDRGIMQASGTTAHAAAHAFSVCESKTLSNTSATTTTIATIGLASNSAGGMHALITVTASDGTNFDSETQDVTVSYVNKAGVITVGTALVTTSTAANNSGSATIGATVTGASPTISLKVTPVFTTIVPTTVTSYVEIFTHGSGAVACQ